MRHIRLAVRRNHPLQISVVGGDQGRITRRLRLCKRFAKVFVHDARGFHLGGVVAGMPDYVAVGEVGYDKIKPFLHAFRNLLRHRRQAQRGHGIERDALGRRNADVLFSGKRAAVAAVEKKGHVRVFFALRAVQLA